MKHNGTGALILRYTRGCEGFFVVTFLLLVGDMASHLLPPFFQQVFTDNIITRKNPEWFGPMMFFYIMLFVLELAGLKGREKLPQYDIRSVICYEGK